ncbi:MAG: M48 family metallopeptidase [Coriobacteriia bacterium]|nr:M48 family metallopeptidase [Coriobacteriia bacterium]
MSEIEAADAAAKRVFHYAGQSCTYSLVFTDRRSLALTVRPDGSLEVRVPSGTNTQQVEEFLEKKWLWIDKQLVMFERYRKPAHLLCAAAGASLYYLGRQYILKVVERDEELVRIEGGKLAVYTAAQTADEAHNRRLLERWLAFRRQRVFWQQYVLACRRFHLPDDVRPQLCWKTMRTQWGSYSSKTHTVYLNSRLIEAPTEAIRFVCIHELCHIEHPRHDEAFYKAMDHYQDPDWRKVKEKLELRFG